MITCYNCGQQVSDTTLICPNCGALVRRYDAPPASNAVQTAPPPARSGFTYRTGQKVWLWVTICFYGIYALICLFAGLFLLTNADYGAVLAQVYEQMGVDIAAMFGSMDTLATMMLVVGSFCLLQCVLYIVLLVTRRKLMLTVLSVVNLIILIAGFLFIGVGALTLFFLISAFVTLLLLRKDMPHMR